METLILKPIQKAIPNRWTKLNFNTKDILVALAVVAIALLFLNNFLTLLGSFVAVGIVAVSTFAYEMVQIAKGDYNISLDNIDLYKFNQDLWR